MVKELNYKTTNINIFISIKSRFYRNWLNDPEWMAFHKQIASQTMDE